MEAIFQREDIAAGRRVERFTHTHDKEWGYTGEDHTYTFAIVHPLNEEEGKQYPMVLALHFSGCGLDLAVSSTYEPNCQDLFKHAEDCYMVILDNNDATWEDSWWGGIDPNEKEEEIPDWKRGTTTNQCENRIMGTFLWAVEKYNADKNRLYCVGVSMGGNAALANAVPRGDLFAAVKVAVPAGVKRLAERCDFYDKSSFKMPDPPILVEYSAQNDGWSNGHGLLYEGARKKNLPLISYWGNFGHDCSDERIPVINDLINTFDIYSIKKNEAYPVFMNSSSDDPNPWENESEEIKAKSGQMNAYFRWKVLNDSENAFEIELRMVTADEIKTKFDVPGSATTDIILRRLQNFKPDKNEIEFSYGDVQGKAVIIDGLIHVDRLTVTNKPQILRFKI